MKDSRKPRRRALRAARVVTLGLALAAPGCYASYEAPPPSEADPRVSRAARSDAGLAADDAAIVADAGRVDSRPPDAGLADAGPSDAAMADGGFCDPTAESWAECCNAIDWDWERGCTAWGPFVPPADGEVA